MEKYIVAELNAVKVNVLDLQKENYKPSPTIDEILLKLYISKEDYYQALFISVDDDYELHLIGPPNSCFVNNHFDRGLRPWQRIWIFNQSSMSKQLLHICIPIFQNLKISVHLP